MTDLPPDDRTPDGDRGNPEDDRTSDDAHRPDPDRAASRRPTEWRLREAMSRFPGVYLDPAVDAAPGEDVHSTVYAPDSLLIVSRDGLDTDEILHRLNDAASRFGWRVERAPETLPDDGGTALPSVSETVVVRIGVGPRTDGGVPVRRPDAWRLLREARREGIPGVSLNHVITIDGIGLNPFTGNPFTGNPFTGNPFTGNGGVAAYGVPGMGGRQPVAYTGPAPSLTATQPEKGGRRPVVAIFDTGCGRHDWLGPTVVIDPVTRYGGTIGIVDPASDPEVWCSLGDPLDGVIDRASGHGTFIAGVVVQACPDVEILAVRVSDGQGVILEPTLLTALGQLVALLEGGQRIDVLNLSFSYYHETPDDEPDDGELYSLLARVRSHGCVVVCSAGNDTTDRPASPASLYAYTGGPIDPASEVGLLPQVVVGALNPSRHTVAMFSNVGAWVSTYAVGVSVLSTMPADFDAGGQADLRWDLYGHRRETLDMDDFRGGFAVWSGTSFAAPLVAGTLAANVGRTVMAGTVTVLPTDDIRAYVDSTLKSFHAADHSRTHHGAITPY